MTVHGSNNHDPDPNYPPCPIPFDVTDMWKATNFINKGPDVLDFTSFMSGRPILSDSTSFINERPELLEFASFINDGLNLSDSSNFDVASGHLYSLSRS